MKYMTRADHLLDILNTVYGYPYRKRAYVFHKTKTFTQPSKFHRLLSMLEFDGAVFNNNGWRKWKGYVLTEAGTRCRNLLIAYSQYLKLDNSMLEAERRSKILEGIPVVKRRGKKPPPLSDEHKKRISEAHKGKSLSDEHKKKLRESLKVYHRTKPRQK